MFEFLKSERFNQFFSFLLGVALMSIFKQKCESSCIVHKAPPLEDVAHATYQLGSRCYQFKSETTDCPAQGDGIIESFLTVKA